MTSSTLQRSLPPLLLGLALGSVAVLSIGCQRSAAPAPQATAPEANTNTVASLQAEIDVLKAEVETLKAKAPDQAHAMMSAAYHFTNLWFAAQEENWPLAQFYLNETKSHLHWAVRIIPVRKDNQGREVELGEILEAVENSLFPQIQKAIDTQDADAFAAAYNSTLNDGCYSCHKASDKPFLRVHLPRAAAESVIAFETEQDEKQAPLEDSSQLSPTSQEQIMLMEPDEVAERLGEPKLRILDTRSGDEYAKGHVPGAVRVEVRDWQNLGRSKGGFHNAEAWAEKVGGLGIGNDFEVVVYGSSLPNTGRIWWTLKYLGLANVTLLNGGWESWLKENQPSETATPKITTAPFQPKFQPDRLEEIDMLKELLPAGAVRVVDTRSSDEFTGKDERGERGGHLPGATHLEWKELLAADGRFKTREQLQQLFRNRGILPTETAVCY